MRYQTPLGEVYDDDDDGGGGGGGETAILDTETKHTLN